MGHSINFVTFNFIVSEWSIVVASLCCEPININSVLAIFRLSLFTLSHSRRLASSAFSANSSSGKLLAATLTLVSSAYIRGKALVIQFGKSLI